MFHKNRIFTLRIIPGPPSITEAEYWREDEDICMKVYFYSQPKASNIYWFKHESELKISRRIKMWLSPSVVTFNYSDKIFMENGFRSKLCMSDMNHIDFHSYRCQIVNIYGSVQYTFLDRWIDRIFYQSTEESQSTKINTIQQGNNEMNDTITHVGMLSMVKHILNDSFFFTNLLRRIGFVFLHIC